MGADCANKITFRKSITQLLNKSNCQGGEMGLVCGYVWHQIRFEFYVKWSAWAWPAMGRIFGLEGVEKKRKKKRQEALKSHCRPSRPTPLPPPPCYLAFVFTWHVCACVRVSVCVWVCICILSLLPVPACAIGGSWCYLMAVLWQPLLRIIKGSCLENTRDA